MIRSLGIDPGTKSFDLALIEGEEVVWESSIPTIAIASKPWVLLEKIREVKGEYDIIAGPSGYGCAFICNEDIIEPDIFASEILLLTRKWELEKNRDTGLLVYKALARVVKRLWREKEPVCYIPSVILLDTVPIKNKLNKIDLGTADKLASSLLASWYVSRKTGKSLSETSFIFIESGYGYNAVITVKNGRVINGYGGTLNELGFLTSGPLDMETVVMGRRWNRLDVFSGGVSTACNASDLTEAFLSKNKLCKAAIEGMLESIANKALIEMHRHKIETIVFSGRNFRNKAFKNSIIEKLGLEKKRIIEHISLKGAKKTKEAAQGYALVAEGFLQGKFNELLQKTRVAYPKGTVLDYLIHPRLEPIKRMHRKAYERSIRKEKLDEIFL